MRNVHIPADVEKSSVADVDEKKIDVDGRKGHESTDVRVRRQLDIGNIENSIYREKWWQLWRPRDPPPPPRASLEDAPVIPIVHASLFSKLTYSWITELMILGYQRTLQAPDLWKMDPSRESAFLSAKLDAAWACRTAEANEWNEKLQNGEINPGSFKRASWAFKACLFGWSLKSSSGDKTSIKERREAYERRWREVDGRKRPSLAWALNDTFGFHFWAGGVFKVFGDTSQLMCPLVVKAIINFGKESFARNDAGLEKPSIGRGVAMAVGLFLLTMMTSVCQHQFFWRSMSTGVLARAALISSIYKRGVKLTQKARTQLPNSALVNHISTDVSTIDACSQWFHAAWTAPIQVSICLIILLVQLGPSALAGFSLFVLMIPLQERIMAIQFKIRRKSMKWTDMRAKVILEVLGAMRVVKYFSYEVPFLKRIYDIRAQELHGVRSIGFSRSANIAMAFSVPVLAATLAFVTYTSTSHAFDVAIIFASFSLFQLLRQPLMFLPRALSHISDAQNAVIRLGKVFEAEVMTDTPLVVDLGLEVAVKVDGATFEWEESPPEEKGDKAEKGAKKRGKELKEKLKADETQDGHGDEEKVHEILPPFRVRDVVMNIPRGQLFAIVGPVGSGKSSLLQGLIGEMRKVSGSVTFGGTVGYCPQTAWIQNATVRDNILFGQPFDEDRYWETVENASLLPDLQVLPDGDLTEIGEKGINLSGGQKQRINIARAIYYNADVVIFDDPLSAVDAHVGKALFTDAILGALRGKGKTVILVTHALHFLSQCDHIYTIVNGRIAEHGTYTELIQRGGEFARLDREFGGKQEMEEGQEEADAEASGGDKLIQDGEDAEGEIEKLKLKSKRDIGNGEGKGRLEGRLIVTESRTSGAISWGVYGSYLAAGRGWITVPCVILAMILMQGSQVLNSYTLVWWQSNKWHRPNSFYQILYAAMGVSQATFTFLLGVAMDFISNLSSRNLHHSSIRNVFYAPMSFFDTTPTGRILSVFGKDIDTIDNQLSISLRLLVLTLAGVFGSFIIITIIEHYFILAACMIGVGYSYFAAFYRASAREMKRLDSLLRSLLYSHFAESLTGLPTIRSYGELPRFLKDNQYYVDLENRALFLTITNQRWLAIRLDFLGAVMVFLVAIFAVVGVSGINPAQIGLVLTYTTQLTQMCGLLTRQTAEVENYMNSVERVVHYSRGDLIPQEAPHEIKSTKPDQSWPQEGSITMNSIVMSYRPGLPNVLKGVSMTVQGGEKIGVVGRTGAGKSSLMLAIFRIVELSAGSIIIDGIDISKIGLKELRSKLSIIPQDPLLFSGTIRSNLDPFNLYDDARLWDALRRAYLVGLPGTEGHHKPPVQSASHSGTASAIEVESGISTPVSRFTLDTIVESEGANLSVGERSLLSLARALVKDSRVVVLDEATASVDLETDSKIQYTIQTEFRDRTLLCIAHRLRTILSYDRILVLDAGQIVEFDTPLNLFRNENGIFRGMCQRSNITMDEIEKSHARFDVS
ncbi:ABC protein [Rickenella mellea]|uniref:ABC protein n=1 Tax=Rickenella mellea TaxID=50990 RepID=A0A4Y7Q0B0_9AGAM|nr:ABC protein [Rickenella mellea]